MEGAASFAIATVPMPFISINSQAFAPDAQKDHSVPKSSHYGSAVAKVW
jgi:hypothetical protein